MHIGQTFPKNPLYIYSLGEDCYTGLLCIPTDLFLDAPHLPSVTSDGIQQATLVMLLVFVSINSVTKHPVFSNSVFFSFFFFDDSSLYCLASAAAVFGKMTRVYVQEDCT